MRLRSAAVPILIGFLAGAAPALADSVTVTSGPDGTTVVNGKPCRVVTLHDGGSGAGATSNSTTITNGPNGLSGSTTISPGGGGASSSVTTGSGSSSSGSHTSSAASSDCVVYHHVK